MFDPKKVLVVAIAASALLVPSTANAACQRGDACRITVKAHIEAAKHKHRKKHKAHRGLPKNYSLWIRIGRCEQPGGGYKGINWSHPGPTYQGGLGFWYGTWDAYKPRGFPADAGQATWRQQMIVAQRVANAVGYHAWGCY